MGWKTKGPISLSGNTHNPGDVHGEQVTFPLRVVASDRLNIAEGDFSCGNIYLNPQEPALASWDWDAGPPPVSLASGSDCVLFARVSADVPLGCCALDAVGRFNLHVETNESFSFTVYEPAPGHKTTLAELELEVRLVEDVSAYPPVDTPTNASASNGHGNGNGNCNGHGHGHGSGHGDGVTGARPVSVSRRADGVVEADATDLVRRIQRECLGRILAVNQLALLRCGGGVALRVRVVQADTLDAADRDAAVAYHCFRGVLSPETEIFITAESPSVAAAAAAPAPATAAAAASPAPVAVSAAGSADPQDDVIAGQLDTLDLVIAAKRRELDALREMSRKEASAAASGMAEDTAAGAGEMSSAEKRARLDAAVRSCLEGVLAMEGQKKQLRDMKAQIAQIKALQQSLGSISLAGSVDKSAAAEMAGLVRDLKEALKADPKVESGLQALDMARRLIVRQLGSQPAAGASESAAGGGGPADQPMAFASSTALRVAATPHGSGTPNDNGNGLGSVASASSGAASAGLGSVGRKWVGELSLANPRRRPRPGPSRNRVIVHCNDGEYFDVHRQLLRPCIALTKAVRDAGSATAGSAEVSVSVSVGCLVFDRVLLFLEAEATGRPPPEFDIRHMDELAAAADALGLRSLKEHVEGRTGEFLSRLREYTLEEVNARNAAGECLLIVDGMVLDVTRWLPEHPGGSSIIPAQALGINSATMFELYHASRESFLYLKHFYLGELSADSFDKLPPLDPPPSEVFLQQLQQHTPFRLPVTRNGARFKSF